ncbi:stage V sporulation protein AB [Bacillus sp. PS06]|uniref:stage V sporulation protein AB n=1 Tax=Bacillus sp. PS06 TaxID=2764176 RepID=UPI00178160E7|nr:stage V sporulation protein AB [Bacillus sp. PS06]MBD8070327.1 stage V sporulation protein AB [Bacillus sp. PS06]
MIIKYFFIIFIGLASGLAVGAGFVAFLTVLGIIPRLTQLTKTRKYIHFIEWGVVFGALAGGWFSLTDSMLSLPAFIIVPIGLACGIYVGMLAAALTEVLNVWPILAKRIRVEDKIITLLMAIVLGKVAGSLFHWLYYVNL